MTRQGQSAVRPRICFVLHLKHFGVAGQLRALAADATVSPTQVRAPEPPLPFLPTGVDVTGDAASPFFQALAALRL